MIISTEIWFPVFTLLAGSASTAAVGWLGDRRKGRMDTIARNDERREAARVRRIEFQRSTLVEMQEVIGSLLRATGQIHLADSRAFNETGVWGKNLVGEDVSDNHLEAQRRCGILTQRTRSEKIRTAASECRTASTHVLQAKSESGSFSAMSAMADAAARAGDLIGAELRSLDDQEDELLS